jgi:hypothetical protein
MDICASSNPHPDHWIESIPSPAGYPPSTLSTSAPVPLTPNARLPPLSSLGPLRVPRQRRGRWAPAHRSAPAATHRLEFGTCSQVSRLTPPISPSLTPFCRSHERPSGRMRPHRRPIRLREPNKGTNAFAIPGPGRQSAPPSPAAGISHHVPLRPSPSAPRLLTPYDIEHFPM